MSCFAKQPKALVFDRRVSSTACRLYAAREILHWENQRLPSLSELAKALGYSRRQVIRAMSELADYGVTVIEPASVASSLKSDEKAGSKAPPIHCAKCGQRCKQLLKVGWCRSCNWNFKIGRAIDRKLDERQIPRPAVKTA